jgi:hypothetical protein
MGNSGARSRLPSQDHKPLSEPRGERSVDLQRFVFPGLEEVLIAADTFLLNAPKFPLSELPRSTDVGVYALYHLPAKGHWYTDLHYEWGYHPIYVGKAVPVGTRRGMTAKTSPGMVTRVKQHARSISCTDLSIRAFRAGFIPVAGVETGLIPAIESYLIKKYSPLWNTWLDGFGNHDPGKGRYNQAWSDWDSVHQGRSWTAKLTTIPNDVAKIRKMLGEKYAKRVT